MTTTTNPIIIIGTPENLHHIVNYSIEAGRHDARCHFDHHGEFEGEQCPANNPDIPYVGNRRGVVIGVTHIDADTFLGLKRFLNHKFDMREIDLNLLEAIDVFGSSTEGAKGSDTLAFMVGVGEVARELKFPRCPKEGTIDVTDTVNKMLRIPTVVYIERGKTAIAAVETTFKYCMRRLRDDIGLWAIGADDPFDPSRPYEDGINRVIVYRAHYKSVSIYCNPKSDYEYAGQTIAGIKFAGHPKACGSPRGKELSFKDALAVWKELAK